MNNLPLLIAVAVPVTIIGLKCLVMGIQALCVKRIEVLPPVKHVVNHLGDN